jgi:hypothetical protein
MSRQKIISFVKSRCQRIDIHRHFIYISPSFRTVPIRSVSQHFKFSFALQLNICLLYTKGKQGQNVPIEY